MSPGIFMREETSGEEFVQVDQKQTNEGPEKLAMPVLKEKTIIETIKTSVGGREQKTKAKQDIDVWTALFRLIVYAHLGSVCLLVLGTYTLHTCLRERLRNASATARGAYARTFVSCRAYADAYARNSHSVFSSSSFAMPSPDADDVEEADDVEDDCTAKA